MKRITAILIAATAILGCSINDHAHAMTCNVAYNGQVVTIDTNPGVIDSQEGWASYAGVIPRCPAYIQNSVIASLQSQNQVIENSELHEAEEGEPVGQTGAVNAEAEANLVRKVHSTINSAIMNHGGNAKALIDNGINWEVKQGGISKKVAAAARQDLYDIYQVE